MGEMRKRFLKDMSYVFLSMVIASVVNIVRSIIIARILDDPAPLGKITIVQNIGGIVGTIAIFSVPLAVTKFISENRDKAHLRDKYIKCSFQFMLFLTLITTAIYAMTSDLIANTVYHDPTITILTVINAISIFMSSIFNFIKGLFRGFSRIKKLSMISIINSLISLPLSYFLIQQYREAGVFLSLAISSLLMIIISIKAVRDLMKEEKVNLAPEFDWKIIRSVFLFSLPIFISGFVLLPAYWLMNTYLVFKVGFSQLGLQKIGRNLYNIFISIPQILGVPLLPMISELQGKNSYAASETITKILRVIMILMLPISLFFGLAAKAAIWILFGDTYMGAYEITYLFMLTAFIDSLAPITSTYFIATGRTWLILMLDVIWGVLFIGLGYPLIHFFGLSGLGYTYLSSSAVIFTIKLLVMKKKFSIRITRFSEIFMIFVVSSILGFFIIRMEIFTGAIIGSLLIIAILIILFLILNKEEKEIISIIFKKIWKKINKEPMLPQ